MQNQRGRSSLDPRAATAPDGALVPDVGAEGKEGGGWVGTVGAGVAGVYPSGENSAVADSQAGGGGGEDSAGEDGDQNVVLDQDRRVSNAMEGVVEGRGGLGGRFELISPETSRPVDLAGAGRGTRSNAAVEQFEEKGAAPPRATRNSARVMAATAAMSGGGGGVPVGSARRKQEQDETKQPYGGGGGGGQQPPAPSHGYHTRATSSPGYTVNRW